ncbi:E3 ubiquitin-protein ligase TRAIP [Phascolarctos cinereus]|uniref:E3 ubiquitin-protein ligase TRAIP n=1 Tax=Phascolarctos cinereus TaxID=38626 RepID=A0A6P5L960_PHACI|nr:E3 ubiquitin-protein ligase TRAIP [Phascolarctos cinereus]
MPIRALCTICSDFFDHSRDVAAIHCGHTFHLECLIRWFDTAPSRTCPQCRIQVGKRSIINKLFFDLAQEEETGLDAETLKNELDKTRAQLSLKVKEKKDCQSIIDSLREVLDVRNVTIESLQKALGESEMLCSTFKKQIKYLEQQQDETKSMKEEACRLRNKMKSMERLEILLQSQRPEVEQMIRDMGAGQSAMEQLAVYCVSLKKEYENLKEARKASGELAEKMRKDLLSSNNKLQKALSELDNIKEELKSTQKDLQNADKEITSLKKKLTILQGTLNLPSHTSETLSRLVLESPAPVEMLSLKLRQPARGEDIDLNASFDVDTPPAQPHSSKLVPAKKLRLEQSSSVTPGISRKDNKDLTKVNGLSLGGQHWPGEQDDELVGNFPSFIRNAVLGRKRPLGNLGDPCRNSGTVRTGFDGLGGRSKYIQPTDPSVIRPLPVKPKARRKVVSGKAAPSVQARLDTFLR